MTPFFVALIGIGISFGGVLMLVRPDLCRGIPPDLSLTTRSVRIGGIVLLFFGICLLCEVLINGLPSCRPNECLDF